MVLGLIGRGSPSFLVEGKVRKLDRSMELGLELELSVELSAQRPQ